MLKKLKEKFQQKKVQREMNPSRFNEAVFEWNTPLRYKMEKGPIWMMVVSGIAAALLFYGAYTANWFFVAAIMTAVVVYAIDHAEPTKIIEIKLSDYGIKIGEHGIPFSNIKSFWIIHHGSHFSKLFLRTHQHLMPDIGIELMDQDPAIIREFLTRHIIEWEGKQEGLMDICTRLMKL